MHDDNQEKKFSAPMQITPATPNWLARFADDDDAVFFHLPIIAWGTDKLPTAQRLGATLRGFIGRIVEEPPESGDFILKRKLDKKYIRGVNHFFSKHITPPTRAEIGGHDVHTEVLNCPNGIHEKYKDTGGAHPTVEGEYPPILYSAAENSMDDNRPLHVHHVHRTPQDEQEVRI